MTPNWRGHMREMLNSKHPWHIEMREKYAKARCFDLNAVAELLEQTSGEIRGAFEPIDVSEKDRSAGITAHRVDIGERALMPAPVTWLEWGGRGLLLEAYNGHFLVYTRVIGDNGDGPVDYMGAPIGSIGINEDGVAWVVSGRQAKGDLDPELVLIMTPVVLSEVLAALALINSPAAREERVEPHRGLERNIARLMPKQREPMRGIIHTKVSIGSWAHGDGKPRASSHPKAYHFCRAHIRVKRGKIERVRAHWRGDPAFGYRLPSYSVKAMDLNWEALETIDF